MMSFLNAPTEASSEAPCFEINVPLGMMSKAGLLDALAAAGRFPSYFGSNWDALSDCLRDLSWIDEPVVRIVHGELPLSSDSERRQYVCVLRDAVLNWRRRGAGAEHELQVVFPEAALDSIATLLVEA